MRALLYFLQLSFLLLSTSAHAEESQVRFRTETNEVRACLPLNGGGVAAATQGGLVLFEKGKRSPTVLTEDSGLPGTQSLSLERDWDPSYFWLGSERGIARVHSQTGQISRAQDWGKRVAALAWHKERLYAALWEGGLKSTKDGITWKKVSGTPLRINALHSQGGKLYAGTWGQGLRVLHDKTWRRGPGQKGALIWSLASKGDELFVASLSGLWKTDGRGLMQSLISNSEVRGVVVQGSYLHWVTQNRGLFKQKLSSRSHFAAARARTFAPGRDLDVHAVAAHGHSLCVATNQGTWLEENGVAQLLQGETLGVSDIAASAEWQNTLWLGSFDQGLYRVSSTRSTRVLKEKLDVKINAMIAGERYLWVGTARGLFAIDEKGQLAKSWRRSDGLESEDFHSLTILRDGTLAGGTSSGLVLISRNLEMQVLGRKRGLSPRVIWALAEGHKDRELWLGSAHGLYQLQLSSRGEAQHVARYSVSSGHLKDDWVTSIVGLGDRLFVGTYAHGVQELREEQGTWTLRKDWGGGYINLGGVSLSGRRLYVATMTGLFSADWEQAAANLSRLHGISPGRDVTGRLQMKDTRIVVTSRRGISEMTPRFAPGGQ